MGGKQTSRVLGQLVGSMAKAVGAWIGLDQDLGKGFFRFLRGKRP